MSGAGDTYQLFEHTADLGIEAWGPTLEEALAAATKALFAQLCDLATVEEREEIALSARGGDDVERAVHFLQEALGAWHLQGLLLRRFEVAPIVGSEVRGIGVGERYDPVRHEIQCELKAVTYHLASVSQREGTWKVRFVVDI